MSCSRLSIQHRCALRPLPRWQARKMMQSWLHRHRSTTLNPRHLPAPSLQSAQRPLMASRLIARCNPGSFSLFTECLHRRPSRRRHNCSPRTARRKKLATPLSQAIAHNHNFDVTGQVGQSPVPAQRQQVIRFHGDAAPSSASTHAERRRSHSRGDGGFVGTGARLSHQAH